MLLAPSQNVTKMPVKKSKQNKPKNKNKTTTQIFKDKANERKDKQIKDVSPTFWKMKREC